MNKTVRVLQILIITIGLWGVLFPQSVTQDVFFREDFSNLDHWREYAFPKVDRLSEYSVTEMNGGLALKAVSKNSASALILRKTFQVDSFPVLRWRWKVENVYQKGDEKTKTGDDYPLRIYVNFKYEPDQASILDKTKYAMAKAVAGEYPPRSALSYIWANNSHTKRILPNAFQPEKTKMVISREGTSHVGEWKTEQVHILKDYRKAFGKSPPAIASLAIMNDSDGTGESSVAYIDFIELRATTTDAKSPATISD